jgi:hypothetical protein
MQRSQMRRSSSSGHWVAVGRLHHNVRCGDPTTDFCDVEGRPLATLEERGLISGTSVSKYGRRQTPSLGSQNRAELS